MGGLLSFQLLDSRLTLKPSFMKYLTVFIHVALEKVRNMDLNKTSILLTQGKCNVPPQVKCSFMVRLSRELHVSIQLSMCTQQLQVMLRC